MSGRRASPVRILHVTESAFGGVGTYLNQIVPKLADWRDPGGLPAEMRLLMPLSDISMVPDVDPAIVHGYRRDRRSLADLIRLAAAGLRQVRDFRPDVVHLHSSFAGSLLRPLLRLTRGLWGVPRAVVYSPHGWGFEIEASPWVQKAFVLIEKLLARLSTRIVTLSDAELKQCVALGFPADRLVRIYNGVSERPKTAEPTVWEDTRLKVFFVGRFDRQKGLDVLFEAVRPLADKVVVRCAGASVVDGASPAGVPANVELLGWMSEQQIQGQFEQADIVVIPSRWEGFGLVAIEAMRAGLPVVATRIGGLPEVVADGVTGRLVDAEDPRALAAALLCDTPEQRRAMGHAGKERFLALFTSERSAAQVGGVYTALLARASIIPPRRERLSGAPALPPADSDRPRSG